MPRFPLSRLVHGAQIVLTALILAAGVIVPAGLPQRAIASESGAAAPSARSVRMFAETGYFVERDAFWDFFGHRGGVRTFGYPVSQDFSFLGCSTQMFQRLVVQQCAGGGVATLNLLDGDLVPYTRINGSTFPSIDATVVERAPAPGASDYVSAVQDFLQAVVPDTFEGEPVGFHRTFETTVSLEDAFPAGDGDPKLLTLLNLELWGLPTSQPVRDPNNGGFVYQRFQRGIMHYDSACACTQGLLLADYLKALITGSGLPADLEEQAGTSPLLRSAISGRLPQGTSYLGAFHEIETLTAGLVGGAAPRGSAFVATTNAIQMAPSITSAPSAPSSSAPLAPLAPQAAPAATATPVSTTVPTRVPTATPSPQPTQAPQLRPSGQFIYGAVVGNPTSTASQAKSAGLTHISAFVPWKNVEPRKGHFLFKQMESWGEPVANDLTNVLNAAKANGLKLVFRLDSPPDWAGGALYKLNP
ncbi:MAG TPA: hypothetical protein VGW38_14395, partial [Chloroflexota bacterium]|nr:hypothetical protein [Chloroflexota bacterium]